MPTDSRPGSRPDSLVNSSDRGVQDELASERTPLITNSNASAHSVESNGLSIEGSIVPRSEQLRLTAIILSLAFVLMLGNNMQPAARIQIYENVVCEQYYATHPAQPSNHTAVEDRCKQLGIQEELAIVKGYEFFVSLIPTLLCSIPYGKLSDRIGRRYVLILNIAGQQLSELWSLAICYWSNIFPVRLLWLGGFLQFIGGGGSVASSIVHVIIVDYTSEAERTQIFLYLHAVNVISGFLGPIITAAMMDAGLIWATVITAEIVEGLGLVLCLLFLPETLHLKPVAAHNPDRAGSVMSGTSTPDKPPKTILERIQTSLAPFRAVVNIFSSNRQALLLFLLYSPTLLARQAFLTVGLIYSSKKFKITFGTGSLILSLSQAIEAVAVLAIVPATSFVMMSQRFGLRFSAWARDRAISIASFTVLSLGHFGLGTAPTLWLGIIAIVAVGLGGGAPSTTLNLLGSAVDPEEVSAVYSAALMASIVLNYGLAPVLSELFNYGMRLGWEWEGLPFMAVGCITTTAFIGGLFIKNEI